MESVREEIVLRPEEKYSTRGEAGTCPLNAAWKISKELGWEIQLQSSRAEAQVC